MAGPASPDPCWYADSYRSPTTRLWLERTRGMAERPILAGEINGARAGVIAALAERGALNRLAEEGLLARFSFIESRDKSNLAFRAERGTAINYGEEWSGEMWREGALACFHLLRSLHAIDLTLGAVLPWWVMFDGPLAHFYNPGSIIAWDPDRFRQSTMSAIQAFLLPLHLCSTGRGQLARLYARGRHRVGVGDHPEVGHLWAQLAACVSTAPPRASLTECIRVAEEITLPDADSFWSKYYPQAVTPDNLQPMGAKAAAMDTILQLIHPRTALDIGANTGLYSRLAARYGANVIAADNDEVCVNRLFRAVKSESADVLPLFFDISDPSPSAGMAYDSFPSARDRLRSELVIALAISHHLALSPLRYGFDQIATALSGLATQWLITEFIPFDQEAHNPYKPEDRPGCLEWYTIDGYTTALRKHFKTVDILPSPAQGRRLIFCETKLAAPPRMSTEPNQF